MELVDGYYGRSHITSDQMGDLNMGIFGTGSYVFALGYSLAHEIVTNNKILIKDGAFVHQGRRGVIKVGTTETAIIENGAQNMKRNDLICIRYQKNTTTAIESFTPVVIKGTQGTTATDPTPVNGVIRSGSVTCDFPIKRVRLNGLSIEGVDNLFSLIPPLSSLLPVKKDGWTSQDIMGIRRCWTNKALTVTSVYSQSSAEYNATVEINLPAIMRPSDPATITAIGTVKASGLFKATFILYNPTTGNLAFNVSTNAAFSNYPLVLGIELLCEV